MHSLRTARLRCRDGRRRAARSNGAWGTPQSPPAQNRAGLVGTRTCFSSAVSAARGARRKVCKVCKAFAYLPQSMQSPPQSNCNVALYRISCLTFCRLSGDLSPHFKKKKFPPQCATCTQETRVSCVSTRVCTRACKKQKAKHVRSSKY